MPSVTIEHGGELAAFAYRKGSVKQARWFIEQQPVIGRD